MTRDTSRDDAASEHRRHLVRALTLIPATAVIMANVIGTGVFVKARVMICNVETPLMVLLVWVVAGLLTLAGALVYAELASMMPRAGGEYNFLGAAYGRACAFFFGWTRLIASSISGAAIAILFTTFLNDLLAGSLPVWAKTVIPIALLALVTILNTLPARTGGWFATVLTATKILLILAVGLGAFMFADGSWHHFTQACTADAGEDVPLSARGGFAGFGAAMLGALWAYNGWNNLSYLAGEVKDPSRTLPRALIGGCAMIMVLYLLINAAYFYVLSPQEVASISPHSSVASEVVARFVGNAAASIMAMGLMLSAYGTLHVGSLGSTRVPFALASDGLLPRALAYVSVHGVPVVSVITMGTISSLLTLAGSFDVLTDVYVFVLWIFYGLTITALFVLRWKYPHALRPFRLSAGWGYPVVPVLFLLAAMYLMMNTFIATPQRALAGFALILAGLPVYLYFSPSAVKSRFSLDEDRGRN